ncbi:SDR family NAD(P)-dependent oxidoreductase [Planomicrobium sp. CPCC 101079]|uniref:SDR family NAD(P)-dependent oxidoreductase n=1 Tax=Planomicrobium sp. CPCC 101079 TaxID=2599618 RepID=UPI0011B5299D|nr:SDR family oxidoreductase [Planomicrobium sp. CPCC 101079]TWT14316.1 SDR family oxidoreductase [Planomicrobium sp. CPCC 101079]
MSIFSAEALNHKHVLITGATGGIGYETAKLLVKMGAKVTITGRNREKLNELETELFLLTEEDKVFTKEADLTNEESRKELISGAKEKLGFINGLVNSSGIAGTEVMEELDEQFIENMMNVNFKSTFFLTQSIYSDMIKQQEGDIVNVASLSGLRGTYGNSAYAASKFAVVGWSQCMAVEAIAHNIRVNAVCPGYVETDMAKMLIIKNAENSGNTYKEAYANAERSIPSGRLTKPDEVANSIAFLLTDAAKNIVGESLKISGGSVMR